ncbi:iron-containing alcohol dehydrogenase [Rhodohalobacter sp. SW132]|uniref:iron-containing alcohol dehydrogenase n=1 Tax=Rhodohalobacter sp. SW132 TaxID=2293433 RepID=UPI000E280C24|nr:iron-containing alcohol dehydrogenase [Rhodohalobacter sp. SW132]REL24040.1 iron-containing alcohol dehydrogenase [Rhodohalobacter sp. SW132]
MQFRYQQQPAVIQFGKPFIQTLEDELRRHELKSIWIVASSRFNTLVGQISQIKGVNVVEHFSRVIQHVPEDQVQKVRHSVAKLQPDLMLAIGGGSAIGLAKAAALKHPLPIWAVPTTFSGSEMTNVYGISSNGKKDVGRHPDVLPQLVIYDPGLSRALPASFVAKSSMNAMAHLVEAVYSTENNPFTYRSALQGIELMYAAMNEFAEAGTLANPIHERFLMGGCLAGKVLNEVDMGLHHKAAHVLGGNFGLDHASVHTVLLPFVFNYQWNSLDEEIRSDFRIAFGADHPPLELFKTSERLKNPVSLKEIGFNSNQAESAAEQIMQLSFDNPAPMDQKRISALLHQAYSGKLVVG